MPLLHTINGLKCFVCEERRKFESKEKGDIVKDCKDEECENSCLTLSLRARGITKDVFYYRECFPYNENVSVAENEAEVCKNMFEEPTFTHCFSEYCFTDLCNNRSDLVPQGRSSVLKGFVKSVQGSDADPGRYYGSGYYWHRPWYNQPHYHRPYYLSAKNIVPSTILIPLSLTILFGT